ncbi:MAG: RHS repeat-associated core domain-containing protein [Phycisphaerales bacterium]
MRHTSSSRCSLRGRTSVAALVLCALAGAACADQILVINSDTLTTYVGGATTRQGVLPLHTQRGVTIDGAGRAASVQPWALAGNPFEGRSGGQRMQGPVDLVSGNVTVTDVDLSLPSAGFSWTVGRSFNGVQASNSTGLQGRNWFQMSQPEMVFDDGATDADDVIYIVYGADRYLEFKRNGGTGTNEFVGRNGTAGVVQYVSGSPDTYVYYDQHGTKTYFFGGNTASSRADWQIWKIVDAAGNTAYVGDATTASTAVTSGYDTSGRITTAYDSHSGDGRRYTYTYSSVGGLTKLTQVKAETKASGTWSSPSGVVEVSKVDYGYYTADGDSHGKEGDLKTVTVTIPMSDSGVSLVKTKYYRYYDDSWSNSDGRRGNDGQLKMIVGYEGCRKFDWDQDGNLDDDFLSASDDDLKPFSEGYFEYENGGSKRVSKAFFNGECGCSGGSNGTYEFTYASNGSFSPVTGYDTEWYNRVIIKQPDTIYATQYFDETGQALSRVVTNSDPSGSPTKTWATEVVRDSLGMVTEVHTPANITGYTHSTGSFTESSSVGLITLFTRTPSGDLTGLVTAEKYKDAGTGGSAYFSRTMSYGTLSLTVGGVTHKRPVIATNKSFTAKGTLDSVGGIEISATNTGLSGSAALMLKKVVRANPTVTTGNNGSNAATSSTSYLRADGTTAMTESEVGIFSYSTLTDGLVVKSIRDCQTNHGSDFGGEDPNTDWGISESSDGDRLITTYTYDNQGRIDTTTLPDGRVTKSYYSKLADGRMVTINFPRMTTGGSTTYFGPASYTVTNHAGKPEMTGSIAIGSSGLTDALSTWIDEGDSDPITALDKGTLARMSVTVYSGSGARTDETRSYFLIPGSGAGSAGTNYDKTMYGYDDMGRQRRVKDATGTIRRTAYDELGRTIESYLGTNDNSFAGGESSGSDDMVKMQATEYDGGSAGGNSYVTKVTAYVQDSTTDQRVTEFLNDARGRRVVTLSPQAPYTLTLYDNMGRVTAVGTYSSTSGLDAGDDPTALSTNRLSLNETSYDEKGRAWKTTTHKIDASDGSDDDTLVSQTWADAAGRVIKSKGPGGSSKQVYDRQGRVTHRFTLAKDNDSGYSDADDVSGDHVLEESQTSYETTTGHVLMQATISRAHDDLSTGSTGALDSNADADSMKYTSGNITGRIQITASWYDELDRVTATCSYGTNGSSGNATTFDRTAASSPPGSSTSTPVTSYSYNDDGTLKDVTDPRGKVTRKEYDAAGRVVTEISNYVNGSPSGDNADDDNIVRYVYANGLRTKLFVDLDGDNVEDATDQVTTYTYGTTKGASAGDSKVGTGHLLQKVTYPDSSSGTDVVTFAYNAQGQQIWTKDQAGNITETDYDTGGRITHKRVSTLAGGFDGAVRRITMGYTSRGQTQTVTQYDNATAGSGSVVDEVKYTYDDWGNVTLFEQDRNSAVSGGGGGDEYDVAYTYEKATPSGGHDCLRRTYQKVNYAGTEKQSLQYEYLSTGNLLDDACSRVTQVKAGATTVAVYKYLGAGQLVSQQLAEAGVTSARYGSGTANYDRLDRFNRIVKDRWTKDGGSGGDLYSTDITFDESGNITRQVDNLQRNYGGGSNPGVFDASYTIDSRNRLTRTQEGHWNGSSISTLWRDQQWTLSQTGNWARDKEDLNGDGDFTDTGEVDDTRTHNAANELLTRDTDSNASVNYTLTHDAVGDLTDDGKDYSYVSDAFGRLRTVKNRGNSAVVAEYTYNGLNMRIGWHYDADADADVDGSDPWYSFALDDRWRVVATFRGSDTSPKELFAYHNAGANGRGSSSYIDSVILRNKDANTSWTSSADGTLEERVYYVQNWRADVSAVLSDTGVVKEWVKYTSYGIPIRIDPGDYNRDGYVNGNDFDDYGDDFDNTRAEADVDFDGDVDEDDYDLFSAWWDAPSTAGRFTLSASSIGNRVGFAGYQYDPTFVGASRAVYHVRNRAYDAGLGRWLRRDPAGYAGGKNLFAYVSDQPLRARDPQGLIACYDWKWALLMEATWASIVAANAPYDDPPFGAWDLDQDLMCCTREFSDCWGGCFAGSGVTVQPFGGDVQMVDITYFSFRAPGPKNEHRWGELIRHKNTCQVDIGVVTGSISITKTSGDICTISAGGVDTCGLGMVEKCVPSEENSWTPRKCTYKTSTNLVQSVSIHLGTPAVCYCPGNEINATRRTHSLDIEWTFPK